jgi:hypothetical protein
MAIRSARRFAVRVSFVRNGGIPFALLFCVSAAGCRAKDARSRLLAFGVRQYVTT